MKVGDLMDFLSHCSRDVEVVIRKEKIVSKHCAPDGVSRYVTFDAIKRIGGAEVEKIDAVKDENGRLVTGTVISLDIA